MMLEMTGEEQEERVRARHEGSQAAVDLMKVSETKYSGILCDEGAPESMSSVESLPDRESLISE